MTASRALTALRSLFWARLDIPTKIATHGIFWKIHPEAVDKRSIICTRPSISPPVRRQRAPKIYTCTESDPGVRGQPVTRPGVVSMDRMRIAEYTAHVIMKDLVVSWEDVAEISNKESYSSGTFLFASAGVSSCRA
ncbi:hypothetical protein Bbelb_208150 [Branchiostoma belcheri]|nr:hypothetical protein Bbelb_208150 [Branchiostoma belcheri]